MNHAGHIVVGLIVASVASLVLGVHLSLQLIALIVLGSILPDIDLHHSKVSKVIHFVAFAGGAIILQPFVASLGLASWLVAGLASLAVVLLLLFPLRLKHRGITHSFKAVVFFALLAALAGGVVNGVIAGVAYASHIIVDKL